MAWRCTARRGKPFDRWPDLREYISSSVFVMTQDEQRRSFNSSSMRRERNWSYGEF